MPHAARDYLLDRFRTDAAALRQRVDALRNAPQPLPGPDAATSARMAAACDDVVAMLEAIPDHDDPSVVLASVAALSPLLEQRANRESGTPAVRAVYAGAATRIREVQVAEATARGTLS